MVKGGDAEKAKRIAATYCIDNFSECEDDARAYDRGMLIESFLAALVAGGRAMKGLKGAKGVAGCKCFLAGTDILMADGSTKNIEDVQVGDEVRATDPENGESGARKVTQLIRTEGDKYFNELSIATEDGIDSITATHEHPFWSPSERDWVTAGDLKAGMTLLTDDGVTVIVTGNRSFTKHARTYNLTVEDLHTYFVLAGETPILVHNAGCATGDLNARGGVYTLRDVDGNVVRTGRTNNLARREREHARADDTADFSFQVEYRTDAYRQQRGLEQVIWMVNGRPTLQGVRKTSPVDVRNKNYNNYMDAAGQFFNRWFP